MWIGLDAGTTNIKALLVDDDGRILARGEAPVALRRREDGEVEQEFEEIWAAACAALRGLAKRRDISGARALGVSSQGGALQVLDRDGAPVRPVISWLDGRARAHNERLTAELGRAWFADHTGHGASGVGTGQILRLREQAPHLLAPPHRIGFVGDCLVARLCGHASQDATSFSIAVMLNPHLRQVDPELLEILGLKRAQLPETGDIRRAAGCVTAQAARATGLPAGIPVSTAVHDQYAAALGTAAVRDGDVMFGAGTAWVLLAATRSLGPPVIDEAFVCPHVVEGLYGQLLSLGNGGSAVSWASDLLGLQGSARTNLDDLLAAVAPGSAGLRFWPFLVGGGAAGLTNCPPGRLDCLRLDHGRAHVLRAVVEGLACELARYLGLLAEAGLRLECLRMSGGGARSRITPQILADVTGLPVACTSEPEMSALGAAILARGLLEPSTDLAALSQRMSPPTRMVIPGLDAAVYREVLAAYAASLGGAPVSLPQAPQAVRRARAVAGKGPEIFLHHVWHYRDIDRAFWAEHLEEWLPPRIIDAHIHVSDPGNRLEPMTEQRRRQFWVAEVSEPLPAADLDHCLSVVYPGREVSCVAMGSPGLDYDIEAENDYTGRECARRGWWGLALLRPQWSAERVAAELDRPGIIGVKPYYTLISRNPNTRDEHIEASIFDFLPHHALEVLNDRRAWATLHVPKADRLGHPDNIREVREIRRRYPDIVLVIAHLGRSYTEAHAQEALLPLADDPGLYFDNSAVLNPFVHRIALQVIGPERILYGTDNPVFLMRGRRQWRGRTYINRTDHPFHFNKRREPPEVEARYTLYMYEALRAIKDACRHVGLSRRQIEGLFHDNAQRLISRVRKMQQGAGPAAT